MTNPATALHHYAGLNLVVSQESLFKWQRLRLARVEATQPEHVQQVLDDARELLARQMVEDNALFQRAREILEAVAKTEALDGFRFWSVQGLQRSLPVLREDLDRFGKARRAHLQEWQEFTAPTARDAANAAVERVSETASVALGVAAEGATLALGAANVGIDKLGGLLGRARLKSKIGRREEPRDLDESLPAEEPDSSAQ
ncbi:hypothetical protein [Mycolicibacterium goodii]|uniref:hypothetical protein n=1 Tax=Mycolicibacterium goodii TaxID=134601 RepID=UPI00256F3887|nr:hypothetical protein [Mycolicibacterium goodii]